MSPVIRPRLISYQNQIAANQLLRLTIQSDTHAICKKSDSTYLCNRNRQCSNKEA
jgi:hypothetical protein